MSTKREKGLVHMFATTKTASSARQNPPSIDNHPLVAKHNRQRQDLQNALTEGHAERIRLDQEREQLLRAARDADIATLLGEGTVSESPQARLTEIETELTANAQRLLAIEEAGYVLEVVARGARPRAERELRERALTAVREVVSDMLPLVDSLETLNEELLQLTPAAGGFGSCPIPYRPMMIAVDDWRRRAEAFVGEGNQ